MSPYSNALRQDLRVLLKWVGCGIFGLLVLAPILRRPATIREPEDWMKCASHLRQIGMTMYVCSSQGDGPLPSDNWCDALLALSVGLKPEALRCPLSNAGEGECSYALNAAAAGEAMNSLPGDMVLLFDSAPGWNQVGGPELLTMDNHGGKRYCVYFVDMHTEWVRPEYVGRLRWTAEEPNRPDAD